MDKKNYLQNLGIVLYSRDGWRLMFVGHVIATIETLYFIKKYGWHWMPINAWEWGWDIFSGLIFLVGLWNLLIAIICRLIWN